MKKIGLMFVALGCLSTVSAQQSSLLDTYRSMALQYNHDLKAAEKNISVSLELEKSVRADRKPKLAADASFRYTGNPMELSIDLPVAGVSKSFEGQHMQYGVSVALLQPVYTGGRILEAIRLVRHQQAMAVNQAEMVRVMVCYQTDIQYWNTVARREIIDVVQDFYDSMASLVKTIGERVDAGLADPQDLLMAEVKLNEAEYRLLQAKNDFQTGCMALNSIIGVELQSSTEIETVVPMLAIGDSLSLSTGMNRPEIKIAEEQVKIIESSSRRNDSQYKPQFYVGMEGNYTSPGYNFRSDMDPNYAAYAKLSVPLFEWGKRRSEKRASTEQIGMAIDRVNRVKDEVALDIQTANLNLLQAQERAVLNENSLEKARENEIKALERYGEGKISILEVIDAQTYRQTSQLNYVHAKVAAQSYYSGLIKALNAYGSF
ncbi:TolC family protein [Sanguibacteroides justesenii]|uniref:Membrane protein n=1 Tax=Sanguibacteroides justesenii TaxID=1547597 RepID=A0AB34R939_9PORP|nr:TolC family protein [Sanguibacteroides justesenii]KIO46387.1 membrane protein [Sanguibacteroides justesenii]